MPAVKNRRRLLFGRPNEFDQDDPVTSVLDKRKTERRRQEEVIKAKKKELESKKKRPIRKAIGKQVKKLPFSPVMSGVVSHLTDSLSEPDTERYERERKESEIQANFFGGTPVDHTDRAKAYYTAEGKRKDLAEKINKVEGYIRGYDEGKARGQIPREYYEDKYKQLVSQFNDAEGEEYQRYNELDEDDMLSITNDEEAVREIAKINTSSERPKFSERFLKKYEDEAFVTSLKNTAERIRKGRTKSEQELIRRGRELAHPEPITGMELAADVLGGVTGFGASMYATNALLSGVGVFGVPARIVNKGGVAEPVNMLWQRAAKEGVVFGSRQGIEQTIRGKFEPEDIAMDIGIGVTWGGVVIPAGGLVWKQLMKGKTLSSGTFYTDGKVGGKRLLPKDGGLRSDVEEIFMKFTRKLNGSERRVIYKMNNGDVFEMKLTPLGNGQAKLEVTHNAPSWLKKQIMGFKTEFADPKSKVKPTKAKVVPTSEAVVPDSGKSFTDMGTVSLKGFADGSLYQKYSSDVDVGKFIEASEAEEIVRQYFNESELPVEVVQKLETPLGERALGRYREGMIEFVKNPHETTPTHEAVHAYMDLYTSPENKKAILQEYMADKAIEDEIQAEEELADGFVRYVRDGKAPGFSRRVIEYFKDMWNKIKRFLGKDPDKVRQMYRDIILKRRSGQVQPNTTVSKDVLDYQNANYQTPQELTTKIMKYLKGNARKEMVNRQDVISALGKPEFKKPEKELLQSALDTHFPDDKLVSLPKLDEAINQQLLPLEIKDVGGQWEEYQIPYDYRGDQQEYFEYVLTSPIKHGMQNHYRKDDLFGHFRGDVVDEQGTMIDRFGEQQYDPYQNFLPLEIIVGAEDSRGDMGIVEGLEQTKQNIKSAEGFIKEWEVMHKTLKKLDNKSYAQRDLFDELRHDVSKAQLGRLHLEAVRRERSEYTPHEVIGVEYSAKPISKEDLIATASEKQSVFIEEYKDEIENYKKTQGELEEKVSRKKDVDTRLKGDEVRKIAGEYRDVLDKIKSQKMEKRQGSPSQSLRIDEEIAKLTTERDEYRERLDNLYESVKSKLTPEENAIFNYRQTYYQRGLKEMIRLRALDGTSEKFRIPLPKTVAYFETWISGEEGEAWDLEGYDFGDDAELYGDSVVLLSESDVNMPDYTSSSNVRNQARISDLLYDYQNAQRESLEEDIGNYIDKEEILEKAQAIGGYEVVEQQKLFDGDQYKLINAKGEVLSQSVYEPTRRLNTKYTMKETDDGKFAIHQTDKKDSDKTGVLRIFEERADAEKFVEKYDGLRVEVIPASTEKRDVITILDKEGKTIGEGEDMDEVADVMLEEIDDRTKSDIIEDYVDKLEEEDALEWLKDIEGSDHVYDDGTDFVVVENPEDVFETERTGGAISPDDVEEGWRDNLDPRQEAVLQWYERTLYPYAKKLRKGNIQEVTDEQGLKWYESDYKPEDGGAVEAYQRDAFSKREPEKEVETDIVPEEGVEALEEPSKDDTKKLTKIPKELEALATEARKYKSAEEFVKAQPKVFHGGREKLTGFKDAKESFYADQRGAVFASSDEQVAKSFGKNVTEIFPDFKQPFVIDAKGSNYFDIPVPKEFRKDVISTMDLLDTDMIVELAMKKKKYDGVIVKNVIEGSGNFDPTDARDLYIGLKKTSFKTKSQLIDIYNQATEAGKKAPTKKRVKETTVSGRDLLKAISSVSKAKEKEFGGRLTEAVSEAKKLQKAKQTEKFKAKAEEVEEIKRELIGEIRKRVPPERRGKFLSAVKNVKTRRALEKALERADVQAEEADKAKVIKQIKAIATAPLKKVDAKYRQEIRAMVEGIDFSKPTEKTVKKLKSRLVHVFMTGGFDMPDQMMAEIARLEKKSASEMSLEDLMAVRDTIATLAQMGTTKRRLVIARDERARDELLNEVLTTTVSVEKKLSDKKISQLTNQQIRSAIHGATKTRYMIAMQKPRIAMEADGGKLGKNTRKLWKEMTYDPQQDMNDASQERFLGWRKRVIDEVGTDTELFSAKSQEKMAMALAYDQNLTSQMEAAGWGTDRPDLSSEQEKIIEIMRDAIDQKYEEYAAVDALVNNHWTRKVKNYFRIAYQPQVLDTEKAIDIPIHMQASHDASAALKAMEGSFVSRKKGVKRLLRTDIFRILDEAIAMQEFVINMDVSLRNLKSVVNTEPYREAAGDVMVQWWNRYIASLARAVNDVVPSTSPGAILNINSNILVGWLGGSISSAVIQPSQIGLGASYVFAKYGAQAATRFLIQATLGFFKPSLIEEMSKETPVIRYRQSGDTVAAQIMKQLNVTNPGGAGKEINRFNEMLAEAQDHRNIIAKKFVKIRDRIGQAGLKASIQFTDVRTTASSFEQFQKLFEKFTTPEEAKSDAEIVTMIVNCDSSVQFRPELWDRIAASQGGVKGVTRALTMLQSFNMNTWNNLYMDYFVNQFLKGNQGSVIGRLYALGAMATAALTLYGFNEFRRGITNFIRHDIPRLLGYKGSDKIEGDGLFIGLLFAITSLIPILNDVIFIASEGYGQVGGATASFLTNLAKTIGQAGKNPSAQNVVKLFKNLAVFLGIGFTKDASNVLIGVTAEGSGGGKSSRSKRSSRSRRKKSVDRSKR